MGAKKRTAAAVISPAGKAEKKSKVQSPVKIQSPEEIALDSMLGAFDAAVGTMLSENVVTMVKEVSEKCLLPAVENRDPLETKFAEAVGAALDASMNGLAKAHSDATDFVAENETAVGHLETALFESNSMKEKADESLQNATDAEMQAQEKKTEAENALETHTKEEKGLQPKKLLMEAELGGLREVQEIARGPADPAKKEISKVQKALREVEAPEALILGIGAAIGKQTPMDQHFVNEATKMLYDKSAKLEGELETFNETVEDAAKKTRTMTSTVEQLTAELNARTEEQSDAKKHQKECIAAVKEAEKQKAKGEKELEKAVKARVEAGENEELSKTTKTHYTFLFERSIVIVEPVVEAVEEVAEAAEKAEAEVEVPEVPVVEAVLPEAAMEVEAVA
jgi:chromosome segregation ATPase